MTLFVLVAVVDIVLVAEVELAVEFVLIDDDGLGAPREQGLRRGGDRHFVEVVVEVVVEGLGRPMDLPFRREGPGVRVRGADRVGVGVGEVRRACRRDRRLRPDRPRRAIRSRPSVSPSGPNSAQSGGPEAGSGPAAGVSGDRERSRRGT